MSDISLDLPAPIVHQPESTEGEIRALPFLRLQFTGNVDAEQRRSVDISSALINGFNVFASLAQDLKAHPLPPEVSVPEEGAKILSDFHARVKEVQKLEELMGYASRIPSLYGIGSDTEGYQTIIDGLLQKLPDEYQAKLAPVNKLDSLSALYVDAITSSSRQLIGEADSPRSYKDIPYDPGEVSIFLGKYPDVSHDLKTHLTVFKGRAELGIRHTLDQSRDVPERNALYASSVERIKNSVSSLENTWKTLGQELQNTYESKDYTVSELATLLNEEGNPRSVFSSLRSKGLSPDLEIDAGIQDSEITWDEARLKNLIDVNIGSNALKAYLQKGINGDEPKRLHFRIYETEEGEVEYIAIQISDEATGFVKEVGGEMVESEIAKQKSYIPGLGGWNMENPDSAASTQRGMAHQDHLLREHYNGAFIRPENKKDARGNIVGAVNTIMLPRHTKASSQE